MEIIVEIFRAIPGILLSYVVPFLLAIALLVFVHEMGHFLFAKLFGMRVERFSIGFPPKILKKQIGETEYVLGATPIGGYVKIVGMVDESMDADGLNEAPKPWEFRAKPVWQRMIVISAGVAFNVLLAFAIFTGLRLSYGETTIPAENIDAVFVADSSIAYDMGLRTGDRLLAVNGEPLKRYEEFESIESLAADPFTVTALRGSDTLVARGPEDIFTQINRRGARLGVYIAPAVLGAVMQDSPADSIGLLPGDRIVALDGEEIRFWAEMTGRIQAAEGSPVTIRWRRPDTSAAGAFSVSEARVAPVLQEDGYLLGVYGPGADRLALEFGAVQRRFGLFEAAGAGMGDTWTNARVIVLSLGRIFTGRENFRENLGGPIMIAQVINQAAEVGAGLFWEIVAMLSITLAIINILPVPALDGGHLVFLMYEGIVRREPSLRFRMVTQQVGMVLLLAFMVFLVFNDILRL